MERRSATHLRNRQGRAIAIFAVFVPRRARFVGELGVGIGTIGFILITGFVVDHFHWCTDRRCRRSSARFEGGGLFVLDGPVRRITLEKGKRSYQTECRIIWI